MHRFRNSNTLIFAFDIKDTKTKCRIINIFMCIPGTPTPNLWWKLLLNLFVVINVCGMAGIGKSYLVKHTALRVLHQGDTAVLYVDCRYVILYLFKFMQDWRGFIILTFTSTLSTRLFAGFVQEMINSLYHIYEFIADITIIYLMLYLSPWAHQHSPLIRHIRAHSQLKRNRNGLVNALYFTIF